MAYSPGSWSLKKYSFRAEPKIFRFHAEFSSFFRSVLFVLSSPLNMLLDTIPVDIIAQIRRKQLWRCLVYLVFRGWRFFLRGFHFNTSLSVLECSLPRWGTYHHLSHVTKIFFSDNCLLCWHFGTERLWTKAVMAIRVGWICSAFLALLLLDSLDVCTAQPGSLRIWVILLCCKNLVLPWFCYAGRD